MFEKFVFLTRIDVTDEKFTNEKIEKWKDHLMDSYEEVFCNLKEKIDSSSPIRFFINEALIEEIIVDAVIGLKKVTESPFHQVKFPNTFKIAAYLAYWWLRHKPISIHYPTAFLLDNTKINDIDGIEVEIEKERRLLIWRLNHINELVAVQIVASFIFLFDEDICTDKECKKIKKASCNFSFKDFEEMKTIILQKLTYYFSYRPITPKVIEHILEGYTFHPAWNLTGNHWKEEPKIEEV